MKQPSVYLKMRVLGAVDTVEGRTRHQRMHNVAAMTFLDEEANARRFTWRTIQTWFYRYKNHGITGMTNRSRKDKGQGVLYPTLIAFSGEGCRIVIRSADVCYTENSATDPVARTTRSRGFSRRPRLRDLYRTPPLPRPSSTPVESRFSWRPEWLRSDGSTAVPRNGWRLRNGSSRRPARTARLSAR
jgi:hypothetical protein